MKRKHFHTFDTLRFFSFLLVFFLHLPKTENNFINFFLKSGGIGVSFFFVLSGFLITYILINEKKITQKISLRNFFARRILRIWPLFYLMVAFAYISPFILEWLQLPFKNEGYKPDLLTSLLFGENYRMMFTNTFPDGAPLRVMWSLCIEEHFYILWGIIFYFIPLKKIPIAILLGILAANITRIIYTQLDIPHIDLFSYLDYFSFGAIPAYILIEKPKYLIHLEQIPKRHKYLYIMLTITCVFVLPNINIALTKNVSQPLFCFLFSSIILLTLGKNAIRISDDLWFSKLGKYTYSLYLFHTIIILLTIQIFKQLSISNWFLLTISSLSITIIVSYLSYHLFEKQFLKLKKNFY